MWLQCHILCVHHCISSYYNEICGLNATYYALYFNASQAFMPGCHSRLMSRLSSVLTKCIEGSIPTREYYFVLSVCCCVWLLS